MTTRADKYFLYLFSAVLICDAAPGEGLSVMKRLRADGILLERFPDLSTTERWALVKRARKGEPEINNGIDLMKVIEARSKKLAQEVEQKSMTSKLMVRQLKYIATADGKPSPQSRRIIGCIAHALAA